MFKQHRQLVVMGLCLLLSAGVLAQGGPPDNVGGKKGKEHAEAAQKRTEQQHELGEERARELEEQAREREEQARERAEEAQEHDQKLEKERNREMGEIGDDDAKRQGEDMPPGLKKKETAPQAGKGSETGQEKRQENSKAWWKFWD